MMMENPRKTEDSSSNREKIVCENGDAFFGKVYSCGYPLPGMEKKRVYLSKYRTTDAVRKSPKSQKNTQKICAKDKNLYVVGKVSGPPNREYFLFSDKSWTFKRKWNEVRDSVVLVEGIVVDMPVLEQGETKSRTASCSKIHAPKISAFKMQFTPNPLSTLWITQLGLDYMNELIALKEAEPSSCTIHSVPASLISLPPYLPSLLAQTSKEDRKKLERDHMKVEIKSSTEKRQPACIPLSCGNGALLQVGDKFYPVKILPVSSDSIEHQLYPEVGAHALEKPMVPLK